MDSAPAVRTDATARRIASRIAETGAATAARTPVLVHRTGAPPLVGTGAARMAKTRSTAQMTVSSSVGMGSAPAARMDAAVRRIALRIAVTDAATVAKRIAPARVIVQRPVATGVARATKRRAIVGKIARLHAVGMVCAKEAKTKIIAPLTVKPVRCAVIPVRETASRTTVHQLATIRSAAN